MPPSPISKQERLPQDRLIALGSFLVFVVILALGMKLRVDVAPFYGYVDDQTYFWVWADSVNRDGLFAVYDRQRDANHPPLGIAALGLATQIYRSGGGDTSSYVPERQSALLKIPSLIFDAAMIVFAYGMTRRLAGPLWALLTSAAIAFNPLVITDSALWGQTDSLYTLFMLIAVGALYFRRNRLTWGSFSLGLLAKLQAITVLPLLVVATLVPRTGDEAAPVSRFGTRQTWKRLWVGAAVVLLIQIIGMTPFFIGSRERALQPLFLAVDRFHFMTVGAYNFWYWITDGRGNFQPHVLDIMTDQEQVAGLPLTARTTGFILFGAFTLLLVYRALAEPRQRNEFLLAGMLCAGFYMLPTQIHERYIYAAIPLFALSMVRAEGRGWQRIDWPGVILFIGFTLTGLYNVLHALSDTMPVFSGITALFPGGIMDVVHLNVILLVGMVAFLIWPVVSTTE